MSARLTRLLCGVLAALLVMTGVALPASSAGAAGELDSLGTEFWLAFPKNYSGSANLSLFITGRISTTGTVSIPGTGFSAPFSVTAGAVTTVAIPAGAELTVSDGVESKAIQVTARDEVSVYGLNRIQYTTDAFLGLPVDILSREYIVLAYPGGVGPEFAVAATDNATTLTITPSVTVGARAAGVPYTVSLGRGQAYQLHAGSGDLTGTIITSNKPVAVFGGNRCANVPQTAYACDYLVEQLTPPSTWGKEFVSMPLATRRNGDTFRFVASTDDTHVSVNGTPVATLQRGRVHERVVNGPARITADKPILVAQYSNGSSFDGVTSDPFVMLVPPHEQFLADYTITTPASGFSTNFVNVVAPTSTVGAVTMDGNPLPASSFTAIPGSSFSGAQVAISLGSHRLAGPQPFGVSVYGFASYDSYGYPGGMSLAPVATVTTVELTPSSAALTVGASHCVDAKVRDQFGKPVGGVRVDFAVAGANPGSGFVNAGSGGVARFCYTGTAAGSDRITASVGTVSGSAVATWVSGDTTPPVLTGTPTTSANEAGWYNGDVTIHWTATDDGSGVDPATVPADSVITGEGTGLTVSASVADLAGNVATASSTPVNVDRRAPNTVTSAPSGWSAGTVTLSLAATDNLSGVAATFYSVGGAPAVTGSSVVLGEGVHSVEFWSTDRAGNAEPAQQVVVRVDASAPSISHTQDPAANAAGWNNTDVTVTFVCADGLSGIVSCTPPQTITTEGQGQLVVGEAVDGAGNRATDTAQVSIDRTSPTIAPIVPGANGDGWYRTPVPVSFTCGDDRSGVVGCSPLAIVGEGYDQAVTGHVRDAAGNTASTTHSGLHVDLTPPTVLAAPTAPANEAGWYNRPVVVRFSCADALSGVAHCPADISVGGSGPGQAVEGTGRDVAGNESSARVAGLNVDLTAPSVVATVSPVANAMGWRNTAVVVRFQCADDLSGVASCPADVTLDADARNQSVTGTALDVAGNATSLTVSGIDIDRTAPTITGATDRPADRNGWYRGPVTVRFDCADSLSEVAACTDDVVLAGDGAGQSVEGRTADHAGNEASFTMRDINIDQTPPSLSGAPTTAPNAAGWYRSDVVIHWTAADVGSGIDPATVPGDSVITGQGHDLTASASVSDLVGNTTHATSPAVRIDRAAPRSLAGAPTGWSATDVIVPLTAVDDLSGVVATRFSLDDGPLVTGNSVTISAEGAHTIRFSSIDAAGNEEPERTAVVRIDRSAPTIDHTLDPAANSRGWHRGDVTVTFRCDDAVSGVASCTPAQTVTSEGRDQTVEGTAVDLAGNQATETARVSLDRTAPTVAADVPAANAQGWYRGPVTVTFTCTDALSGVFGCTGPQTVDLDGAGQSLTGGAEDLAGNTASTTVTGINIDTQAPVVSGAPTSAANEHGWYRGAVVIGFRCADSLSGIAACPLDVTLNGEGANQSVEGTARDNADNTATTTVPGINIDTTAPSITARATTAPNADGWYNGPVVVHFTCDDQLSGVASCPADVTLSAEGANQSVDGAVTDRAGNRATFTLSGINIDVTAPTITGASAPAPNANGWNNTNVTVEFVCADTLSGVTGCPSPVTVLEGADQSVTGVVSDLAGNSAQVVVGPLNVDKTRPLVQFSGNAGVYTVDQTVDISCSATDALSGIERDSCAAVQGPAYSFGVGTTTRSATAVDRAGNETTVTATFTVRVTTASLCNLTRRFVSDAGIAHSLCVKLSNAEASTLRGNLNAKAGQLDAYRNELSAQAGKAISSADATLLRDLSRAL